MLVPGAGRPAAQDALLVVATKLDQWSGRGSLLGWVGVIATTALGAVMTGLYLMTGSLWVVMLVHVLVDLNGLVVTPVLGGVLKK